MLIQHLTMYDRHEDLIHKIKCRLLQSTHNSQYFLEVPQGSILCPNAIFHLYSQFRLSSNFIILTCNDMSTLSSQLFLIIRSKDLNKYIKSVGTWLKKTSDFLYYTQSTI